METNVEKHKMKCVWKEQIGKEKEKKCTPLCFDEQVVWELSQMIVLEVQDL